MSKLNLILAALLLTALLLAGCQPSAPTAQATPPQPSAAVSTPTTVFAPSVTPTSTPTLFIPSVPPPQILPGESAGDAYETVLSFPAGKTGFPYRGIDMPGMEITGPNAFGIFSDGRVVIADLIDNRLWLFTSSGELLRHIDLYPLGIFNVSDLQIHQDEIYVLEIYLDLPVHYRINLLSPDGALKTYYDIPEGYHLENGLTGFQIDCGGQIFLNMAGQLRLLPLLSQSLIAASSHDLYECNGKSYAVLETIRGEKPKISAGSLTLGTSLTFGLGGLSLLKVNPDGSFFVVRSDVVNDRIIQVDDTVHFISADGSQLGVARVPVAERYYYVMRNLTVGPDGNVYCLLPRPNSLMLVRLKFYTALTPLLPGAEAPVITRLLP